MAVSFESRLEQRLLEQARPAHAAEAGDSSDSDGSVRIDPVTSTPGQRAAPEGLVIHLDEDSATILSDTSWMDELGTHFEEALSLIPRFNGERCGSLYARFFVKKDPRDGQTIIDRYVHLGNLQVNNTRRQGKLREKGIGSALLNELERHARRFGASRIEGVISPIDLPETPTLPLFYEHRGYEVTPQDNGFKKIVKHL